MREQVHSNPLRKEFIREFCQTQTFSESSHKLFRIGKFRIHNLSEIILYRINVA